MVTAYLAPFCYQQLLSYTAPLSNNNMVDKSLNCSDILDINYAYVWAMEVTVHLSQNVNTPLKINLVSIDKEMDLFQC